MDSSSTVLIELLTGSRSPRGMAPSEWSDVIASARAANLLGSLGEHVASIGHATGCNADRHLAGALQLSERQRHSVRWEAQCINDALLELGTPVVLLKGAAYVLGGHANAIGRIFGDIDLLVQKERIGEVELKLMIKGWAPLPTTSVYDDRYYRQWMHEIPPLVHVRRGSVLDVHHTILPPTARIKPDPRSIIDRSMTVPELPALRVPCPEDLVIHSITHLVHEGELHNGLRDLYDIHILLSAHSATPGFWERLSTFTIEHGLEQPVALGLRLVRTYFATNLPTEVLRNVGFDSAERPPPSLLERIYDYALAPQTVSNRSAARDIADLAVYVRAHWLRMPPLTLARHLARKTLARLTPDPKSEPLDGEARPDA